MRADSVSVIIPFYQRSSGVLARTLEGVARQTYDRPIDIVVVDDESPVGADAEISGVTFRDHVRVQVIRQKNGGPGAARNTGLDHAEGDFIAFLDSDDVWHPDHLLRAARAFESGAEIYAAAGAWPAETAMGQRAVRHAAAIRDLPEGANPHSYRLAKPDTQVQLAIEFIELTSLCVLRKSFGDVRFRRELRWRSEDMSYIFDVLRRRPMAELSLAAETQRLDGVNIFQGVSTGETRQLQSLDDGLKAALMLTSETRDDPPFAEFAEKRLAANRNAYAYSWLVALRRNPMEALRHMGKRMRMDPSAPLSVAIYLTSEMARRFTGKRS